MPLVELDPLFELEFELEFEFVVDELDFVEDDDVEPDVDVFEVDDCAVAFPVMPDMRATVSAPASAAAAEPASAARLQSLFPFMVTTIRPRASGRPHRNIKPCSSLRMSGIRGRAAPE